MKKLYLLLVALFAINFAKAQPTIQWQKSLGGTVNESAYSIWQTTDGGYIAAGWSFSNDGDVIGHHGTTGNMDYWIVKLNSAGIIEWQKSLGGTDEDGASSIQQTTDGGYIVAGWSYSNDGDVTGNHGSSDYWIVKLNSTGTIEWQKSLGGTNWDKALSIEQTVDGGYIAAGCSNSDDGDVLGNHGHCDYWIVKLNSAGTLAWQKSLGGTEDDIAESIQQTTDGGYIVAGWSYSNDGDITGHHGPTNYEDYWIVKLNSSGTIEWQKSLGGTESDVPTSIRQTTDGGYIVAGNSYSIDGDITGHHGPAGFRADYWVVKLNSTGTIVWQKSLGGTEDDSAESILQTTDGGYIVAGWSLSNDGDVTEHHGSTLYGDYWLVKLNSTGNIAWQKSLGGSDDDWAYSIQQTTDGGYIVAGCSFSNDGDASGHHGNTFYSDYWVVKLSPVIGIDKLSKNNCNLNVYPNPANKVITIELPYTISNNELGIYNINGKEVKKLNVFGRKLQTDVNDLPGGVYFLKVWSELGVSIAKFVKE